MTANVLTDEQIETLFREHDDLYAFGHAIAAAVLQSEQVQAWKRDAELWRAMQEHSVVTFMNDYGRKLAIATVELGRFPEKLALEQFVRAAMEKQP